MRLRVNIFAKKKIRREFGYGWDFQDLKKAKHVNQKASHQIPRGEKDIPGCRPNLGDYLIG